MTPRDKQIEQLLVRARKALPHIKHKVDRQDSYCLLSEALALHRKPTCETCGDSRTVVTRVSTDGHKEYRTCPDCKEADG